MMLPLWVDTSGRLGLFSYRQDGLLGGTELQKDAKRPRLETPSVGSHLGVPCRR